jgi:hypothetical protein
MEATENLYITFGLIITNEPLELGMWNQVWLQIINISTYSAWITAAYLSDFIWQM